MGAVAKSCCTQSTKNRQKPIRIKTTSQIEGQVPPPAFQKNHISIDEIPSTDFSADSSRIRQLPSLTKSEDIYSYSNFKDISKRKANIKDFEILGKLGSGSFGTVFLAQLKKQPKTEKVEKYAVKRINLQHFSNQRIQQNIKFEKNVLQTIDHPFLTSLCFAFKDARYAYLVMECGVGGAVDSFLSFPSSHHHKKNHRALQFRGLGEEGIRFVAANAILGLQELHRHNIMYRDLKPENVIVFEDGYAKLTDFGLSKFLSPTELTNTEAGTLTYFAPEIINRSYYTKAIDLWALGVFLYELATSESPYKEHQLLARKRFKEVVKKTETERDWKHFQLSSELKDLINKLLRYEPQERLGSNGFHEIRDHAFFQGLDWHKLYLRQVPSPLLPIIQEHPIKVLQVSFSSSPDIPDLELSQEEDDWAYNSLNFIGK